MGEVNQPGSGDPATQLAGNCPDRQDNRQRRAGRLALSSSDDSLASIHAATLVPRSVYAGKLDEFPSLVFSDQAAFGHRGCWNKFFRQRIGSAFDGRIIFEIGCSDATFLSRLAARHPYTGFVGLDWKCRALYLGAQHVNGLGLGNVALLRGRGQDVLKIFAEGEVDEVWVFHPDPCDRVAELKNRLIAEPFLVDLHTVLRSGLSTLSLKTDHPGYYQWVLGLFGLPEPAEFAIARESMTRAPGAMSLTSLRMRCRDLMRPQDIPRSSDAIRRRYKVAACSANYWHDPDTLAHTAGRCFTGEVTSFESRFIGKRLPIYYFEICKQAF